MTMHAFNFSNVDSSWQVCLERAIAEIDPHYIQQLAHSNDWLPGPQKIFNAFSQPLDQVKYVLFGESPYPRSESANGYAFWDAAVQDLWSPTGLSKKVNRATSLRNIIKMLLVAEGKLDQHHLNQEEIAKIDKKNLVQTNQDLFNNLLKHGFLLLNTTPVLHAARAPHHEARAWKPFVRELIACLLQKNPDVTFILFGRIATTLDELLQAPSVSKLYAEHPYNYTFITNQKVQDFFKPLHLLHK